MSTDPVLDALTSLKTVTIPFSNKVECQLRVGKDQVYGSMPILEVVDTGNHCKQYIDGIQKACKSIFDYNTYSYGGFRTCQTKLKDSKYKMKQGSGTCFRIEKTEDETIVDTHFGGSTKTVDCILKGSDDQHGYSSNKSYGDGSEQKGGGF